MQGHQTNLTKLAPGIISNKKTHSHEKFSQVHLVDKFVPSLVRISLCQGIKLLVQHRNWVLNFFGKNDFFDGENFVVIVIDQAFFIQFMPVITYFQKSPLSNNCCKAFYELIFCKNYHPSQKIISNSIKLKNQNHENQINL